MSLDRDNKSNGRVLSIIQHIYSNEVTPLSLLV